MTAADDPAAGAEPAGPAREPPSLSAGRVVRIDAVHAPAAEPAAPRRTWRQQLAGADLSLHEAAPRQWLAAAIGSHLVAIVCGLVGADYVESANFGLILPGLSGLACAALVSRAGPRLPRAASTALAAFYGVCSAAFAFVYADTPYGATGTWLPPLLCAVVGAVAWPYVDPAPPKRPQGSNVAAPSGQRDDDNTAQAGRTGD